MGMDGRPSPSQKKSCDRCRQQKVRCLRHEAQRGDRIPFASDRTCLSQCERCTKAGVDCVYSFNPTIVKHQSSRRSVQTSIQTGPDYPPRNSSGTSWIEQGLSGAAYPSGPSLEADFAGLSGQFPGIEDSGAVAGFNGWDANLESFSPTSIDSLAALSAAPVCTAPSTTDGREGSEDVDDGKDPSDAPSSQLTSLSQRAMRAMRRLVRPGCAPLTVSSPEVNEVMEDTNTLIRIVQGITAQDRDTATPKPTTSDCGLAFLALACHQNLVALFQAICDAILRCLQSKKEHQQRHHGGRKHSDVGPSSVAQFVMVLQLLMHLINRMDRSLFQSNPSMWDRAWSSTGGYISPVTPNVAHHHTIDSVQSEATVGGSSPPGGLLALAQDIVAKIPHEHEKLRQVIQKLQTKLEHSELH